MKGSEVCRSCGLCCDGTLQTVIRLRLNEAESASRDELKNLVHAPCLFYSGHDCSIYTKRPPICRSYQCRVLKAYLAGTLSFQESATVIAEAKRLVERIRRQLEATAEAESPASLELAMDLQALQAIGEEQFGFEKVPEEDG